MTTIPKLSIDGPVATVRLDAPDRHNALSLADITTFSAHLDRVGQSANVRVLVLLASGASFCSGHHLEHFTVGSSEPVPPPLEFEKLANTLEAMRIPSICALQGSVYAGGIDIALACDFRIGVPAIRMRLPAARLGIQLYPGALRRYATRLGLQAAKKLCLAGSSLGAEQMRQIGFLDEIVEPSLLQQRVVSRAQDLARGAPLAVQGMKKALNGYANGSVDERELDAGFLASFASADLIEGLRARAERREPVFTGH